MISQDFSCLVTRLKAEKNFLIGKFIFIAELRKLLTEPKSRVLKQAQRIYE